MEAAFTIDRSGPYPVVAVSGLLTIDSSPRLRSILLGLIPKNAGRVLAIDVSGVIRIDLSGLATLLEVLNRAHECSAAARMTIDNIVRSLEEAFPPTARGSLH